MSSAQPQGCPHWVPRLSVLCIAMQSSACSLRHTEHHGCHWRTSLKPEGFLVTNCPAISAFSLKLFSQTWAEGSVIFLTLPCMFQFMTLIQIPPKLTIFCVLNSSSSLNYFSLLFLVIQLFCTMRTWGQDIILIRDALKSLKLSHFVSSH